MAQREEHQHQSPRDVPPVGRPRGAVWRALQADGVVWEGQVLLVGDDVDLAARMIVTHRRVAFVRGGDIVLEIERSWMRQEPVLRRDGVLELFVAMPGSNLFDEPLAVPIRMREGHPAAGHIIAMLAPGGVRRIAPDSLSGMERARQATAPRSFGGFWDEDEAEAEARPKPEDAALQRDSGKHSPSTNADTGWLLKESPDRVVRLPSTPPHRTPAPGFSIAGIAPRDQRRSPWRFALRLGALLILLATAAALGAGRLHLSLPGRSPAAVLTAPSPTQVSGAAAESSAAAELTPDELTAIAVGVGGGNEETSGNEPVAAVAQTATETPSPPPAGAASSPAAIVAPTKPPIPTPAQATTPELASPTTVPSPAAPLTATVVPAAAAENATVVSTPVPAAASVATPAEIVSPPAAVAADEAPAPEIVVGPLRLAFTTALRAESLPRYGLPPGSGEWLLLVAEISNGGDAAGSLALPEVRLFDRGTGQVVDLDTGMDVIASLAGFDPAWSAADTVKIEPGDTAMVLLLYLLPPGSSDDLALVVDQVSLDVAPLLALGEAEAADLPQSVPATVSDVLDGATIVVDINGVRQMVQYLGLQAPTGDACFAGEAAAANTQLVGGQQIWLERQATDGVDGVLLRDVWVSTPDGGRALVAARLLEAGEGTVNPVAPNTRYEAWLAASEALARTNGAGLWSACPIVSSTAGEADTGAS